MSDATMKEMARKINALEEFDNFWKKVIEPKTDEERIAWFKENIEVWDALETAITAVLGSDYDPTALDGDDCYEFISDSEEEMI